MTKYFILSLVLVALTGCGKKPDDKLECGENQLARGGECIDKPKTIRCEEGEVRRGAICMSSRDPYCTNWANNYPECNQCPEGYKFELNRCRCDDAACYDQAQCADPEEGAGRRLLFVNTLKEEFLANLYGVNMKPSVDEIQQNTGIEVVHEAVESSSDFDGALAKLKTEEWDAVWVLDGNVPDYNWNEFAGALKEKMDTGVGVAILADNDPFTSNVAGVLKAARPEWGMEIVGDYKGEGAVSLEGYGSDGQGKLFTHEITIGLYEKVSEGVTISHISGGPITNSPNFKPVLRNTEGNTGVAGIEEELADQNIAYARAVKNQLDKTVQRTVVHTGFTALYQAGNPDAYKWAWNSTASPGTPLLWFNMACWTANVK